MNKKSKDAKKRKTENAHYTGLRSMQRKNEKIKDTILTYLEDYGDEMTITDFIVAAQETNTHNVLAALLEYKNNNFSDFDPMDEFTLEW